jgi:hypothetical protein
MVDRAREERPIVFTITFVNETILKVYTKDARWEKEDLLMTFEDVTPSHLFCCIDAITVTGNAKGYAVLFEVD